MNIQEASDFFEMNPDIIREYEEKGLLTVCKNKGGHLEIHDEDAHRLCLIRTFLEAGSDMTLLKRFLELWDNNIFKNEKIQILKKQRFAVLDEIHVKQQLLDRIDFIIQKVKDDDL